jgi:predicted O-methyltransferase YrrM
VFTIRHVTGTAFDIIDTALRVFPEYRRFRAGELDRVAYSAWVEASGARLGLDEDKRNLSTRFPLDGRRLVRSAMADLEALGVLSDESTVDFDEFAADVGQRFDHGGRTTFIFPEEARLLFALAHRLRPRNAVFLGSFYGYWAIWAMPGIIAAGGRATLVDLDPEVLALARRNLDAFGFAADYVCADAVDNAASLSDVDLCVLDAEGPEHGPDPTRAGKAIYHPITEAVTPAMAAGGVLVAHNVLLDNLTDNRYFAGRIARNEAWFGKWLPYLAEHYDAHLTCSTSEGVGIYRRIGPSCAG